MNAPFYPKIRQLADFSSTEPSANLPKVDPSDLDRLTLALAKLQRIRRETANTIEALLAALDELDGDPDLEEGGDLEPSSGWADLEPRTGRYAPGPEEGEDDDPAEEDDPGEDIGDEEPSLGAPNVTTGRMILDGVALWPSQHQLTDPGFDQSRHWAVGDSDVEDEHDGREHELGWTDPEAGFHRHQLHDREGEHDDREGEDAHDRDLPPVPSEALGAVHWDGCGGWSTRQARPSRPTKNRFRCGTGFQVGKFPTSCRSDPAKRPLF